jgi:hypothetical protein
VTLCNHLLICQATFFASTPVDNNFHSTTPNNWKGVEQKPIIKHSVVSIQASKIEKSWFRGIEKIIVMDINESSRNYLFTGVLLRQTKIAAIAAKTTTNVTMSA